MAESKQDEFTYRYFLAYGFTPIRPVVDGEGLFRGAHVPDENEPGGFRPDLRLLGVVLHSSDVDEIVSEAEFGTYVQKYLATRRQTP